MIDPRVLLDDGETYPRHKENIVIKPKPTLGLELATNP